MRWGQLMRIDYYFSVFSVFAYLAGSRLEDIAARHGATITYKPLDLTALLKRTGGTLLSERHPSRLDYRLIEIERVAGEQNMPIVKQPMFFPPNPAPASYAIIAAQKAGGGDVGKLVRAILAALWAEDRNIADDEVIRAALSGARFDPSLADSGLLSGAEAYAANLEEAVDRGVFGSPFYITEDGGKFWGQDRLEALDRHLAAA